MKKIILLPALVFFILKLSYCQPGQIDSSFGINGFVTEDLQYNKAVAVQKDAKIVTAGSKWNGNHYGFAIARYNTEGSPDHTFGNDGIQTTYFASGNEYANTVILQKDKKIIAAGENAIARYNTDGSLDMTFSGDGKKIADSIYINAAVIQDDGKIVVAGGAATKDLDGNDASFPAIARYNADGSIDKTFGINGSRTVTLNALYGNASSIAIQSDGKIVISGTFGYRDEFDYSDAIIIRFNKDGSLDSTYGYDGQADFSFLSHVSSSAVTLQRDDKAVLAATSYSKTYTGFSLVRLNTAGYPDSSFKGYELYNDVNYKISSVTLEEDKKIIVAGDRLFRFNSDGTTDHSFGIDGMETPVFSVNEIAVSNNKLYAVGGDPYGMAARYLLADSNDSFPALSLTAPANNATYLAPAAHIKLSAAASDADGTISKVEFYNGNTLLHTETVIPYGYVWRNVKLGNYTLTAKAYDNSGNVTTSAPVHISVVMNKPPVVKIIKPANNPTYPDHAYIHFEAAASDTDGRVTRVEFYNDSTLLRTEYQYPYTYVWRNVRAGTYTITAKATDNWGAQTISEPITVRVKSESETIVSSRPDDNKTDISNTLSLKLSPNPATNIINIQTSGLQQSKAATLSIISVSGNVLKKVETAGSAQTIQLDVSSLTSGVYTIKIVSGDEVLYKQFVKL